MIIFKVSGSLCVCVLVIFIKTLERRSSWEFVSVLFFSSCCYGYQRTSIHGYNDASLSGGQTEDRWADWLWLLTFRTNGPIGGHSVLYRCGDRFCSIFFPPVGPSRYHQRTTGATKRGIHLGFFSSCNISPGATAQKVLKWGIFGLFSCHPGMSQ